MLAACASGPTTPRHLSSAALHAIGDDLSAKAVVLRAGFTEIREKALEPPPIDQLFLAGLGNFRRIDSALGVRADAETLTLSVAGDELLVAPRPAADDLGGWVSTTLALFDAATASSDEAAAADAEVLYKVMFDGALGRIDQYSRYSGRRTAHANRASRNGTVGLGFTFDIVDEGLIVRSVVAQGPLDSAGVRANDIILAIDEQNIAGVSRDQAMRLLAGPSGSQVSLAVRRAGMTQVSVAQPRRGLVIPKTVTAHLDGDVAVVEIGSFNIKTAADVAHAVHRLRRESERPLSGLVLDLRGDPGGLLDQAVEVSDMFLDTGVIANMAGRHPGAMQYYAATPGDIIDGLPIVVVVDGKSASAAEIVAAALSDNNRALVIGTNTLGKGTVQTLIRLPNDGEIALTWSRVVSPGGYIIHDLGVLPTVCTSGAAGSVAERVEDIFAHAIDPALRRLQWRTGSDDPARRAELRRLCPAEHRPGNEVDAVLAVRLAADRGLYARSSVTSLAESR
ncbi:MAG: S41 family peptidase [Rhodospirillaceae bacterium]|nr:S41 family peptidase [Rhodospirillaceae bacterium]